MISLKPSDSAPDPKPFDGGKRERKTIAKMTLDEVTAAYLYPPKTPDGYLHVRYLPVLWTAAAEMVSKNHLFLHALCLAEADESLKELIELRKGAGEYFLSTGDQRGLRFLAERPTFNFSTMLHWRDVKLPAWSMEVRDAMGSVSSRSGISSRVLVALYGFSSLLSSSVELGKSRDDIAAEMVLWGRWIKDEIGEISQKFRHV